MLIRVLALLTGGAAIAGLLVAGESDVTRPRLERSLESVYVNLYLQRAELLGHTDVTAASVRARTTCDRGGPTVADTGAGADWICHILFTDLDGVAQDGKFELAAKSNACYVATGPSRINGPVIIAAADGRQVLNPVFEFDACYDPAG